MAKRRSAKEWSRLVKRWQRSGLSCKEFAAAEGVARSTLSWWKWRLGTEAGSAERATRSRRRRAAAEAVRVVEVAVAPAAPRQEAPVELVLGEDVVVRLRRGFDAETLREVVAVFAVGDEPSC